MSTPVAVVANGGGSAAAIVDSLNPGYKAIEDGALSLKSAVQNLLGIHPSLDPKSSSTDIGKPQFSYDLAAQLTVRMQTDWEVVEGFKLKKITLRLALEVGSDDTPTLRVKLEAYATVGELDFFVEAEIPELKSARPVDIIFTLTLQSQASPDKIMDDMKLVKGLDNQDYKASTMVDSKLSNILSTAQMAASLQLVFRKPVDDSFFFRSLLFVCGGDVNYQPGLADLEIVNGLFAFALIRAKKDSELQVIAQLEGNVLIAGAEVKARVGFRSVETVEKTKQIVVEIAMRVSSGFNTWGKSLSTAQFLTAVTAANNGKDFFSKGNPRPINTLISQDLGLPSSMYQLNRDLQSPALELSLYARCIDSSLDDLVIRAYARNITTYRAPFLRSLEVQHLVVIVKPLNWKCSITGVLVLPHMAFDVRLGFSPNAILLRADLRSGGVCSLATLARMDIFNNEKGEKKFIDLVSHTDSHSVGKHPPLSLNRVWSYEGGDTQVYFEMFVTVEDDKSPQQPNGGEATAAGVEGAVVDPNGQAQKFTLSSVKFFSHYGIHWDVIPGHVEFKDLGICFEVFNPTVAEARSIRGYVYGQWKLKNFSLWMYILGEVNPQSESFWAGLTIQTGDSNKLTDVVADQSFAKDLNLALLDLPGDIGAQVQKQQLIRDLTIDGRLKVRFLKGAEDSKFTMKEIQLNIDLESTFYIFERQVLATASLDVQVFNPMEQEKEVFGSIRGSLQIDDFILQVEAIILQPATRNNGDEFSKQIDRVSSVLPRKDSAEVYGKGDIKFLAHGTWKNTGKPLTGSEVLGSSLLLPGGGQMLKEQIPTGYPLAAEDILQGVQFSLELRVGKMKSSTDARSLKALALSLTSTTPWQIIEGKLRLENVSLRLLIDNPRDQKSRQLFLLEGIIHLGGHAAAASRIVYSSGLTTVNLVLVIPLSDLANSLEQSTDVPKLLKDAVADHIVAFARIRVKDGSLESYLIDIQYLRSINISETITLESIQLGFSFDRTQNTRHLQLGGNLRINAFGKNLVIEASARLSGSRLIIQWSKYVPLADVFGGLVGGIDQIDKSPPRLGPATGFENWDKDSARDPGGKDKTVLATMTFEESSSSRSLKEIAFALAHRNKWALVENYIWLENLVLLVSYNFDKQKLAVEMRAVINLRGQGEVVFPLDISLCCQGSCITTTLIIPADCKVTDVIYSATGGYFDIPRVLGLPFFPQLDLETDWEKGLIVLSGKLLKDGDSWEFRGIYGKIARMMKPRLEVSIQNGKATAGSLKGTARFIDLLDVEVEFVLPKGPLKVAGHDVTEAADMIKELYKLIKGLKDLGENLPPVDTIALGVGAFVSSVAAAGAGLVTAAGILVGGFLGGAAWSALKKLVIDTIISLVEPGDRNKVESALSIGLQTYEAPKPVPSITYGGEKGEGSEFTDSFIEESFLSGKEWISAIKVLHGEAGIRAIQIQYSNYGWGPRRGGSVGPAEDVFLLKKDEFIVAINGRSWDRIHWLQFETNLGRKSIDFGNSNDGDQFRTFGGKLMYFSGVVEWGLVSLQAHWLNHPGIHT